MNKRAASGIIDLFKLLIARHIQLIITLIYEKLVWSSAVTSLEFGKDFTEKRA